jgi:hypothetical protein
MLAGAALAAYGFNYDETHHGEKGTGMPMIALGLWTSLAGLLGFIGTGIYLHIRY